MAASEPPQPAKKRGGPRPNSGGARFGAGRPKGVPNKITGAVKDMILAALDGAGGAKYLQRQATENPAAFMTLVGKVLPLQLTGEGGGPIQTQDVTEDRAAVLGLIDQLAKRASDAERPTLQ